MKLRVSEVFSSIQNEGFAVGKPSIFIRTFGCNFRCKQYGVFHQSLDGKNKEVEEIIENLYEYSSLYELPKVKTGCNTYFSTYSEFRKFTTDYSVEELIELITYHQPKKAFSQRDLVFTGGEPLQNQIFLKEFFQHNFIKTQKRITFETNGTYCLDQDLITVLNECSTQFLFSVSPKLSNSGHIFFDTFIPEALRSYNKVNNSILVLKFLISKLNFNEEELFKFIKGYLENGVGVEDIFLLPEGSVGSEEYISNSYFVVDLCLKYGFRFS